MQATLLEGRQERRPTACVTEQLIDAQMRCRRLAAGRDLDARRADPSGDVERRLEGVVRQGVGVEAELQRRALSPGAGRPA